MPFFAALARATQMVGALQALRPFVVWGKFFMKSPAGGNLSSGFAVGESKADTL